MHRIQSGLLVGAAIAACAVAGSASALPYLSEVYYDAPGSDDGQLFVEIAGPAGLVLDGLRLEGVNGSNGAISPTIPLSGVIGADGLFVVADRTGDGVSFVPGADLLANFDFQNGPDSIVLRDADDRVRDAVGYGVFAASEVFAGEGAAAPDVSPGESLARRFADLDTDDNAVDFVVLGTPTPGTATFAPIPEPGTTLLLGLGLAGLSAVGRRPRIDGRSAVPSGGSV